MSTHDEAVEAAVAAFGPRMDEVLHDRAREALAAVLPLAVAEEREACAKMIEGMGPMGSRYDVAHAIRSRGEPR